MEKFFKLKEHNTNVKTELIAGLTTFMTMAYILIVNPDILSVTGMNKEALFTATALASIIGTVAMALLANYPFALAPGMGLNAFFAFGVVLGMGYSWQVALTAVFVEGIIFILLSVVNVREALFNAIPLSLKHAVGAGIGLFIAFIGLVNGGVVKTGLSITPDGALDGTLVALGDVTSVSVVLALIGIIITGFLVAKKVKGAILLGILGTWILAMFAELTGLYVPDFVSTFPVIPSEIVSPPPSISGLLFKFDFSVLFTLEFITVVFAFLFVDLFDTLGTLIGVSSKAGLLDKEGKLPKAKQALLADAIATTAGACLGTSTTTTYVESAAGVSDGGRTGLTALATASLFVIALFFSPIFMAIPGFATAPALVVVGFFMMESVIKINFADAREGIPAFLTIIAMPLTYSISEGIAFGIISYTLINVLSGNAKKVNILMYILTVLFVLKYIFV